MTAELSVRIDETTRALDDLTSIWGECRPTLAVHGLPHELIHTISGQQQAFHVPANGPDYWALVIDAKSATGGTVKFYGLADQNCETCSALMREAQP